MHSQPIRPHTTHPGVFTDGADLYTRSLLGPLPRGTTEATLRGLNGHDYRPFPPTRTKLAAIVKRRARAWPFTPTSRVLYLGAGAGTTVSFLSDICPDGMIYAVEFAPEPFRDLVGVARGRRNVVPILADARTPAAYRAHIPQPVDVVYQDVAQRDQWDILRRNADAYLRPGGWAVLIVKAKSVDVARPAREVYDETAAAIAMTGYTVEEFVELDPYEREHGAFMLRRAT